MNIKIGSRLYECLRDYESDKIFVIKTNDIQGLKEALDSDTKFYLIDDDNIVIETRYTRRINDITLKEKYYIDENGDFQDAISFSYESMTINEKIDSLEDRMNGIYDTDLMSLNEYKTYKINQSKQLLANYLETHPITATVHNNTPGVYSITKEKQDLLSQNYITYQLEKTLDPENAKLTWNETGDICEEWTEQEFVTLIMLVRSTVYPLVSHQQALEKMIMGAKTKAEVDEVELSYDLEA